MNRLARSLAITIAVAIAVGDAAAQEARVDSLRRAHSETAARVVELAAARDSAGAWAEALYRRIPEARQQGTDALRYALAVAQFAADSLDALDASLADALAAERQARRALIDALESELEHTLREAEVAPPAEKLVLTDLAQFLANQLAGIREPLQLPATELPAVAIEPGDGPVEITLKADFLVDRATQLRNAADVVAAEITRVQRRGELHDEMRRLVAEVRLFDDAGLPPVSTQGEDRATEPAEQTFDPPGGQTAPGDAPISPVLDLPLLPLEGEIQLPLDEGTLLEQLGRLREYLLQRAEALEQRADEFRRTLRGPP